MTSTVTGSLVVTAKVDGTVVRYTIHPSDRERDVELKVARYSELDELHKRLIAEVPNFNGRLPAKTLRRRTTSAFVENRRKDIEVYLRQVATNHSSQGSNAWQTFVRAKISASSGNVTNLPPSRAAPLPTQSIRSEVSEMPESPKAAPAKAVKMNENVTSVAPPSMPSEAPAPKRPPAPTDDDEESEDEPAYGLGNTLDGEMIATLSSQKEDLGASEQTKKQIEEGLSVEEQKVLEADTVAQERAAVENNAQVHLNYHFLSLQALDGKLASKRFQCADKERQQTEVAIRIEEQLALASEAAKKQQLKFETARRAVIEVQAKTNSKVLAAMAEQVAAETANAAAKENHTAMTAALAVLQERAKARLDDVKVAERELDVLRQSQKTLDNENSQALVLKRQVEAEANAASGAVDALKSDAARRNRAHEVEIRRAQERNDNLATLRDMRTRGMLIGEDRANLEPAEHAAFVASEAAADTFVQAQTRYKETKAKDQQTSARLLAVAVKTTKHLRKRETIAAAIGARVEDSQVALHKASAKQAAVGAAYKVVQQELESVKGRVEGSLAEALPQCAARLEAAEKSLVTTKKEGEEELAPLRHSEEAEATLLKSSHEEEGTLVQKLDEAQMAAAEAQEDAAVTTEKSDQAPQEIDFIVKSSQSRCDDREKEAKEAAEVYVTAMTEAKEAQQEADDYKPEVDDSMGSESYEFDQLKGQLDARAQDLQQVAEEKKQTSERAAAALAEAKQELASLEAQHKANQFSGQPLEKLVSSELGLVNKGVQIRKERETSILGEAKQNLADWQRRKEALGAELHRAELEVRVHQQNMQATKDMYKSFGENK